MKAGVFGHLLQTLPPFIQAQVLRYKNRPDQERCLIGKLLLIKGLGILQRPASLLNRLKYTEYGRPYIDSTLDFNIAHSGTFTLCAISDTDNLGIDIEKKEAVDINDFESALSGLEMNELLHAVDQRQAFYKLWTRKEAVSKAIGSGLNMPLHSIASDTGSVSHNGRDWFLHEIEIDGDYVCHLCTSSPLPVFICAEVKFAQAMESMCLK